MLNIKKVLTELSNKFSRYIYTADYVTNSVVARDWIGARQIRRIGDLAVFTFNGRLTGNLAAATEVTIAKINNDAYLPYGNMITVNIPTQDNKGAILLMIKTTGEISLYASSAITTDSTFARAQVDSDYIQPDRRTESVQLFVCHNRQRQRSILRSLDNGIVPAPERGWWCA